MTTYSELRSNAERIADEALKERVLRGIEVLTEYDPEWADYIDPSELLLGSATQCVLGQVFDTIMPRDEQWEALKVSNPGLAIEEHFSMATEGYFKGLAILNGDAAVDPSAFGFDTEVFNDSYDRLTEAWLVALGEDD